MTKKTVITSLCLLLVLAALIVGYRVLKNKNASDAAAESEEAAEKIVWVNTYDAEDMTKISYLNDTAALSFERGGNDTWQIADDPDYPIDSAYVDNMANAVSGLAAKREIETEDDGSFGFDVPSLIVKGEYNDGTKLSITVGATNDFNGQLYLKDEISGKIYLVESGFSGVFDYTRESLMLTDTFPTIDDDKLTSMTVRNKNGDECVVTDEVGLADSASIFKRMTFSSDGAFFADAKTLAACGIDLVTSPFAELAYKANVSVSNDDGTMSTVLTDESLKMVFGNAHTVESQDDDGNVTESTLYYYSTPGSSIVYSTTEAVYEELMRYATYIPAETDAAE